MSSRKDKQARRRELLSASELIGSVLDHHRIRGDVRASRAIQAWPNVVGPRIAARSWPVAVRDQVLWVAVANPSWLHQLGFLKGQILEKLAELVGADLIKDVQFELTGRARPLQGASLALTRKGAARARRKPPDPASGSDLRTIERDSEAVEDEELRRIIASTRKRWNL